MLDAVTQAAIKPDEQTPTLAAALKVTTRSTAGKMPHGFRAIKNRPGKT